MLEDAHKGQEVMGAISRAIKEERWGDAGRDLEQLMPIVERLMRGVGDKIGSRPDEGERS